MSCHSTDGTYVTHMYMYTHSVVMTYMYRRNVWVIRLYMDHN